MPPERKQVCDCRTLEDASKEPEHPIRWDERMNEYYIAYGKGGRMMIYYCPFCGGRTPESRRASFFAHVTQEEETRIYKLFEGLRTVTDVIERFGPPDEEREFGFAKRILARHRKPGQGEVFRTMVYKNLSPVASVQFLVGTAESVRGTWIQKAIGMRASSSEAQSPPNAG